MSDEAVDEERAVEFELLFAPILDRAFAYAYSLCRNHSDAENLVQEAALKAFAAFSSYRTDSNFKAWYLRILTNCHYEQHRKHKHIQEVRADDCNLDLFLFFRFKENRLDQTAEEFWKHFQSEQIAEALGSLPLEFKAVTSLYFLEGYGYEEIAQILNLPLGTVRSRMHRGRKLLQARLWHLAQGSSILAREEVRHGS